MEDLMFNALGAFLFIFLLWGVSIVSALAALSTVKISEYMLEEMFGIQWEFKRWFKSKYLDK